MQSRVNIFSDPGGDTIQILKTKECLEKIGCTVAICCDYNINLKEYDLIHLFNITQIHETYLQYLNAKKQCKPIILSPIYQNFDEQDRRAHAGVVKFFFRMLSKDWRELIKTIARAFYDKRLLYSAWKQLLVGFSKQQKEVLCAAQMMLPNSQLEAEAIEKDYNINFPYQVVPYAVDHIFLKADDSFVNHTGWKDYVLCVGNFIERKNQLRLIEAMAGLNLPLVLVGAVVSTQKAYYRQVQTSAEKADFPVKIITKIPQNDLVPIYSGAKVVALPSWIETCGMACLEGALADCNVVITNRGHSKEYFRDMAFYFDPADVRSIRKALLKAYASNPDGKLKERIFSSFTWARTAEITKRAYEEVLVNA